MVNVMVIVKDMQKGCVVKMDEEVKDRLESYQTVKRMYEGELEGKEGRDKEAIEFKIESCRSLIEQIYEKDNPTKKKGMYK